MPLTPEATSVNAVFGNDVRRALPAVAVFVDVVVVVEVVCKKDVVKSEEEAEEEEQEELLESSLSFIGRGGGLSAIVSFLVLYRMKYAFGHDRNQELCLIYI